jgi:hypothetical protein
MFRRRKRCPRRRRLKKREGPHGARGFQLELTANSLAAGQEATSLAIFVELPGKWAPPHLLVYPNKLLARVAPECLQTACF